MIKIILLLLAAINGIPAAALAECERLYTYSYSGSPYDTDKTMKIHVPAAGSTKGSVLIPDDVIWIAEFCGPDSDYFCFLPWFAVPKHFDSSVRKWTLAHHGAFGRRRDSDRGAA